MPEFPQILQNAVHPQRRNALLTALPADSPRIITTTHLDWMPDVGEARVLRLGAEK